MNLEQLRFIASNLEAYIKSQIPNFSIEDKSKSFFMKVLSYILFFNRNFMSKFITTWYPKIYFPHLPVLTEGTGILATEDYIVVLVHEWVHLYDRKRLGWFFNFLFLFPQILIPLPIPSTRAWLEYRGYRATLATLLWVGYPVSAPLIERIVDHFCNMDYYCMFPFRKYLVRKFTEEVEKMRNGYVPTELSGIKHLFVE